MRGKKEGGGGEEEKEEKGWERVKGEMKRSGERMDGIDRGEWGGYRGGVFVRRMVKKVWRVGNEGEVEMVGRGVELIWE